MGFTLTARLGRGRTVETFSGKYDSDGRRQVVVVKRPIPQLGEDPAYAAAFETWASAVKLLNHPNVVEVIDAGRDDEGPYIIADRVYGAPLALILGELSRRKRTLRPELAFGIALQMAEGLAYLHEQQNQIHGGVDPGDVMVGYAGEVRLADPGLHLLDARAGAGLLQIDTYLAPEARGPRGEPSKAGDVFAVALVMLEMLIGKPVWTSPTMTVEASIAALKDFSHVGQAQPALTDDLVTVLGLCVEHRIESRLPSGHELHTELLRIARKNQLAPDDAALGSFVRALLPEPSADEAPTMLVSTSMPTDDEIDQSPAVRAASVVIDPEDLAKALEKVQSVPEIQIRGTVDPSETTARTPSGHRGTGTILDVIPGGQAGAWRLIMGLGVVALLLLVVVLVRLVTE